MAERHRVQTGPARSITCALRPDGKSPAKDFLDNLDEKTRRRFTVSFQRMADEGHINNKEHFRKVQDRIWEFKRFQHRIGCFQDGQEWVLTHGFIKKGDKWPRTQVERAVLIMTQDKDRETQVKRL